MVNLIYTLMNKDIPLCDFEIVGEGELEVCNMLKLHNPMPEWATQISGWVGARSAAKHRVHINKILDLCGGKTKSGFIALTHCLSLTDTLWVKSEAEDVSWAKVNLYENKFDEVISKATFNGNGLYGIQMSTTSPELTTDGTYDKCWLSKSDGIHLIKAGSTSTRKAGLEPYGEVLASEVFEKICDSVTYKLGRYDGRVISDCKLFTSEKFGYRPIAQYLEPNTFYGLPKLLKIYADLGAEDEFRRMVVADCITLNSDRHFGNFGFLVDNDSYEQISINPCFDFNMAFVPFSEPEFDYNDNFDDYLSRRGPVIGSDYVAPAKAIMTPAIKACVEEIRETELVLECDERFCEKRLATMNMIKNVQCDRILGIDAKWKWA